MQTESLGPRAYADAVAARRQHLRQAAVLGMIALAAVVGTGVALRLPEGFWVTAAGTLALALLAARFVLWKCPACGAQLPGRGGGNACLGCDRPFTGNPEA